MRNDPIVVGRSDMIMYWIRAQAPRRVLALAKHLGVEAEFVELDLMGGGLREAAYAALNPNMKAPTLVDGDLVLWESSAIMTHLCIKAGSDMWPADNHRLPLNGVPAWALLRSRLELEEDGVPACSLD
jgi:glutathione S-transferase